ncbi:MAG: monofunctional biosynthetic peptidoglycan transglycosylase [Candidatus Kapabacteria bacterium]|nr:monofunctional biosynthetic peptidoglycan transglycosylase [Ignavibacteriota bacterium]MCW5884099.1 monofunctional biosynthetic peptidoglycan transglycosylase [Candidatus Kapabacteria bacterium]
MKKLFKFLIKYIFYTAVIFIVLSVGTVVLYKYVNPPVTPHMIIRVIEGLIEGDPVWIKKSWIDYDETSTNIFRAFVGAEDARFMTHEGIDWRAVEDSKKYNKLHKGKKKRGASTITMQTAKNTFLPHSRTYIRKGFEVYFTYLIEFFWGKKRILEVYANIVEMGPGLYGVEAASQKFFGKSASKLSDREAALLASVLPNPRRWAPDKPTNYINKRVGMITTRMNQVQIPKKEKKEKK